MTPHKVLSNNILVRVEHAVLDDHMSFHIVSGPSDEPRKSCGDGLGGVTINQPRPILPRPFARPRTMNCANAGRPTPDLQLRLCASRMCSPLAELGPTSQRVRVLHPHILHWRITSITMPYPKVEHGYQFILFYHSAPDVLSFCSAKSPC